MLCCKWAVTVQFSTSFSRTVTSPQAAQAIHVQLLSKCTLTMCVLLSSSSGWFQRSLPLKLHAGCPNQACFCLSRQIPTLTFDSTFAFSSRPEFQDQVYAVSTLNEAVQCHPNTLKRKVGCICWWALVVLLRQENFRKPSSDWSTHVTPPVTKQVLSTYCSKMSLWPTCSFLSFGYSLWTF